MPLSYRHLDMDFRLRKGKTNIELIVRRHAARARGGAEGCACYLVPGSQVAVEIELWVWDRVEARADTVQCVVH